MKKLLREIHRRSLWQILGIYLVGGWVALQVVELLGEAMELPEWVVPLAIVMLVIGLPMVMATAFVQEGVGGLRSGPALRPFADPETKTEPGAPFGEGTSEVASGKTPAATPAPVGAHHRFFTWRNAVLGGVGAFAIWGLVAAVWVLSGRGTAGPGAGSLPGVSDARASNVAAIAARAGQDIPAVAVLPFADMGSDDEYAYFADGVHEDILTNLSKVQGLLVLSRGTVLPYRDNTKPLAEVAAELDVDALVEGSVRRLGHEVRITAQLTDPATGATLWAESYDRSLDDIFAVQSEIAIQVAGSLEAALTPAEQARITAAPTTDLTAYDLYKQGREAYYKYSELDNERSIQLFRQAIAADSMMSDAWAGLADAYAQTVSAWSAPLEWADSAIAAGLTAVRLAPESSVAHKALALAQNVRGNNTQGVAENERALELDPNNWGAANNLAMNYWLEGRYAESAPLYLLSDRLNPHQFPRTNVAFVYASLGMTEEHRAVMARDLRLTGTTVSHLWSAAWHAISERDRDSLLVLAAARVELNPTNADYQAESADFAFKGGQPELAESMARAALRLSQHEYSNVYKHPKTLLAEIALMRGDTAEARSLLNESLAVATGLDESGAANSWNLFHMAGTYALLGDVDSAMTTLERVVELGGSNTPFIWEVETTLDPIRADPRFVDLIQRVREHSEAERSALLAQRAGS